MGNNLYSGLLQEDYKVTIENDLGKLDCAVTELSNSTLECIYDITSGRLFSEESTSASVTVIVSEKISYIFFWSVKILKGFGGPLTLSNLHYLPHTQEVLKAPLTYHACMYVFNLVSYGFA